MLRPNCNVVIHIMPFIITAKPAHAFTSIKQSPVLNGHLFCPVRENLI